MLENDLPYFGILDESNEKEISTFTTPGSSTTTGTVNTYGNYASYSANTTYNPGQTFFIYKPETGLLVRGFKTKPEEIFVFDAAFIARTIKTKYKIE